MLPLAPLGWATKPDLLLLPYLGLLVLVGNLQLTVAHFSTQSAVLFIGGDTNSTEWLST